MRPSAKVMTRSTAKIPNIRGLVAVERERHPLILGG